MLEEAVSCALDSYLSPGSIVVACYVPSVFETIVVFDDGDGDD